MHPYQILFQHLATDPLATIHALIGGCIAFGVMLGLTISLAFCRSAKEER